MIPACPRAQAVHARREVQAHVAEPFWAIHLEHRPQGASAQSVHFTWDRGRLFDHAVALLFYAPCVAAPEATITRVSLQLHEAGP